MENKFLLYKSFDKDRLLNNIRMLQDSFADENQGESHQYQLCTTCAKLLIENAVAYGLHGNLWHNYITLLLVKDENPFSLSCEKNNKAIGSLDQLAEYDLQIIKSMFDLDLSAVLNDLPESVYQNLIHFTQPQTVKSLLDDDILEHMIGLSQDLTMAENVEQFKQRLMQFYQNYGVGKIGLNKAFGIAAKNREVKIIPITNMAVVQLSDLVGYEIAKKKLVANTESFIAGKKANNCLLFGDAGTGKSTSIKALLNQYYDQGLRIIEIYKYQYKELNAVISQIKNRNYKFILYMDDLSFEEFETEYKYLKAIIEGGLQKKPDNVLIYATSNRRHLVKEMFSDKEGRRDQLHASDTVQEKLSLAGRFGVTIFFCAPDKKEFQEIVRVLAEKHGIRMDEEKLLLEANKWELSHGGLSGRTAQQFIDYLAGSM